MKKANHDKARFVTRLSKEQKQLFERATVQDIAIFFETLVNPPKPNNELISAKNAYDQMMTK